MDQSEIIEALKRSGYLLESETAQNLQRLGFFVETNQTIKDPITLKGREIDLTAEFYRSYTGKNKNCASKIRYVFEIKNNIFPIILLTEYQFTPNQIFEDVWKTIETFPKGINYDNHAHFSDYLFPDGVKTPLFTQYCSFQKKKNSNELMAIHPDELYEGLSKIVQFTEEAILPWVNEENENETYYRNFLYLPVVLINSDLFELNIDEENTPILSQVGVSRLIYNYHFDGEPKSSIVYFVTKAALDFFLADMIQIENKILNEMMTLRQSGV